MRSVLFLLPYLAVPVLLAVLVRKRCPERWQAMTYVLCPALLLAWPLVWQELLSTGDAQPDSEEVDNMFPTICALFLLPIALGVQYMSNVILARKDAE